MASVEASVLSRIRPAPDERDRVRRAADRLLSRARDAAREEGIQVEPILVGSVAKETYLSGDVDIDVFLLFPPDLTRGELERQGLRLARRILPNGEEKYAEHPYLSGEAEGFEADVVPCYRITDPSQRMTAVDRTPFHTAYVNEHLTEPRRVEVLLLKRFLKGIGVYGAEARTQGVSGYLTELLVLKYGTFRGVLEAARSLSPGRLLALEPAELTQSFSEPLVFLDPVDPRRNAAAALSAENLLLFSKAAREYLAEPRETFFFPRAVRTRPAPELVAMASRRGGDLRGLAFARPPDVLEDAVAGQLRKCARALREAAARAGFEVPAVRTAWEPRCLVLLDVASATLSETAVHDGPPSTSEPHAARFRSRWEGHPEARGPVFEELGRLKVTRRREHPTLEALLEEALPKLDLGKDITPMVLAKHDWLGPERLAEEFPALLSEHLDPQMPWERS
ncbi:MAG: CCA tRNA nucleotidyltransferase [Methanobacteriota archaeon]